MPADPLQDYLDQLLVAGPTATPAAEPTAPAPEPLAPATQASPAPAGAPEHACQVVQVGGLAIGVWARDCHGWLESADWRLDARPGSPCVGTAVGPDGTRCRLVDLAALVLGRPPRTAPPQAPVLLVAGGTIGLCVDGVGESCELDPAALHWRGQGGKRPWLAATRADPPLAVLDVAGLLASLPDEVRAGMESAAPQSA